MPRPGGISWSSAVEWESGTEPDSQQGRPAWLTMRSSRDPGALRSGALAARQRRGEIVEHLLGIGLAMQITARQSLPRSRSISPSLPQPTNAGVEPRPSDILAAPRSGPERRAVTGHKRSVVLWLRRVNSLSRRMDCGGLALFCRRWVPHAFFVALGRQLAPAPTQASREDG